MKSQPLKDKSFSDGQSAQLLTLLIFFSQNITKSAGSCAMLAVAAVATPSAFSTSIKEQPCFSVSPDEKHQEL